MASSTQDPTTTAGQQEQQEEEKPWHAAFPAPRLQAGSMPAARAQMVLSMKIASMLIIDVRRTDYEAGCIRGSLNIPAQGFWWNRGMLWVLSVTLLVILLFVCLWFVCGGITGWWRSFFQAAEGGGAFL
jgi:hypothetical protein